MSSSKESKRKGGFGHWVRVAIMFLSFGFIFPHAMTEDMDSAKPDANKSIKAEK